MTTPAILATRAEGEAVGHFVTLVSEDIWGPWRLLDPQERVQAQQRAELSQQLPAGTAKFPCSYPTAPSLSVSHPPLCCMCQINRSLDELIEIIKTKEAFFSH